MTQPQHEDPFAEARNQLLQGFAVAATVGEAAARWAAVNIQNRAAQTERQTTAEQASRAAQRLATTTQDKQDRALIDKAFTDWLSRATLDETVRVWRTATVYAAAGHPRAGKAAWLAQERLRQMNGPLMDAYDRHRANGMSQAEAMKAAAYEMWEMQARYPSQSGGRPHGTREPDRLRAGAGGKTLPPGGASLDELDAAVRAEAAQLAAHISPEALDQLQREWRLAGQTPAADAAGLLLQLALDAVNRGAMAPAAADALIASLQAQADTEQRAAALDSAERDDPATGNINEHHQGEDQGRVHTDVAAADLAAAGERQRSLMSQTFPPLTTVGGLPAHVSAKQPANTSPAQRKAKTR
ncbi:hypothetical protein ACQPZJ_44400 [Actinoplanes sp. CA-054009]